MKVKVQLMFIFPCIDSHHKDSYSGHCSVQDDLMPPVAVLTVDAIKAEPS